jgi:hypothetical protein
MTTMRVKIGRVILASAALVCATVAAGPVDQLDRFAGTWQTQGTFVDTPYSTAGAATGTATCAWATDHQYMICQQNNVLGGKQDDDVAIYSYDEAAQAYKFYSIRPSRSTTATITIDKDSVTYPFSFTNNGETVSIRTLNTFTSPDFYNWRSEYSTDLGKTWTLMASGTSQRTSH